MINKNMESKSWIAEERDYKLETNDGSKEYSRKLFLNEQYEKFENNKLSIPLLDHQLRTVKAMCDLRKK